MRQGRVAGAVIGIDADPARTQHFAVANFEKTAFELISHIFSFSNEQHCVSQRKGLLANV
jgi:hypothetical protein